MVKRMKKIYIALLIISSLTLAIVASALTFKPSLAQEEQEHAGPYLTVDPVLTKVGPSPAVGQTFNLTLSLFNVTTENTPNGLQGVEVHLNWNNSLIEPVSFISYTGTTGGVLLTPVVNGLSPGFYDSTDTLINAAPYTNATSYAIASASTGGPWWGNGTIAQITFKVDAQPEPWGTCPIAYNLTDLEDATATPVTHDRVNATFTVTTEMTNSYTIAYNSTNYIVSIKTDSLITASNNLDFSASTTASDYPGAISFNVTNVDGFCNVTIPNNLMSGNFLVNMDGTNATATMTTDSSNSFIWIYTTAGTHTITIYSTAILPEFASTGLIILLMASTIAVSAAVGLKKRKIYC
jgi:hypothetical protein